MAYEKKDFLKMKAKWLKGLDRLQCLNIVVKKATAKDPHLPCLLVWTKSRCRVRREGVVV